MMSALRYLFPRRKENLLNLILFLLLIALLCIYYFSVTSKYSMPHEEGFTWPMPELNMEHVIPDYSKKRQGPGENGAAIILSGEETVKGEADMKTWFMNVVASDKISLDRSLPDARQAECRAVNYSHDLPSASVIIIFTDEAWSPLLRTVHSIINRSPLHLLKEILLVDDFSTRVELKEKLDKYVERFGGIVRVIRLKQRHGLIRAKLAGAKAAIGEVIVFLDSHCEANHGWLEPLVNRIKEKRSAVICPVIDHISAETMRYSYSSSVGVGGFWWSLHFRWDNLPDTEVKRRKSSIEPVRSPTMAGGLLAANREYFFEVGGYDAEMDIWGGENLEISFRVWMCGGSIEFIPCSHVGHIFRAGHPYNMTGRGGNKDVHGTNSKRLAEVWMDEYKRLFYYFRIELKNKDVGDLTERKELRSKLKCKSFKWYLDNVIPYKFVMDENVIAFGAVENPSTGLCLDTLQRDEKTIINLGVFSCQRSGSSSQFMSLTKEKILRRENLCARIVEAREDGHLGTVILTNCQPSLSSIPHWITEGSILKQADLNLCLDTEDLKNGNDVVARECVPGKKSQIWKFVNFYSN